MSNAVPEQAAKDHIEAIAIGIETLGFDIGSSFERRAKASLIEQSLKLCGYSVVPLVGVQREDVARAAYAAGRYDDDEDHPSAKTWDELEALIADATYDPIWKRELIAHRDLWLKIADAIRALPHTGQPREGDANLIRALKFYADPKRYCGANLNVDAPDEYQPINLPYLLDVTRDGGRIARDALSAAPASPRAEGIQREQELLVAALTDANAGNVELLDRVRLLNDENFRLQEAADNEICAACGERKREHAPGGTRWGPTSLCGVFIPAEQPQVTFCYVTYRACTASCPTREECAQIAEHRDKS